MPEKDTLKTELIDLETIERTIQQWVEAPEYMERFPSKFGLNKKSRATVTKCVCDLQEQCVQEVLIYGSGQAGEELYDALLETNIVVRGFIDSTASSHALAPDGNPPMLPETALEKYPGVDVVIASISYRNPMLHRLLQAGLNGRRVWVI